MGLFSIISTCNFVKFNDLYLIHVFTLDISFECPDSTFFMNILMFMAKFKISFENTDVHVQI